ncbi:MAG: hypothetical protein HFJ24_00815 [Clostridia bacterium]|nr:hypothetical protein [Clostridia bacterium]
MFLKVYGVISQILEPGAFTACVPIFVNSRERNKYTKFYRFDEAGNIIEVDLRQYGAPVFLPAGKKKVNDGIEYFICYRSTQNFTHEAFKTYCNNHILICADERINWMPASISMGIKFPDKFVAVEKPNIDEKELERMMK